MSLDRQGSPVDEMRSITAMRKTDNFHPSSGTRFAPEIIIAEHVSVGRYVGNEIRQLNELLTGLNRYRVRHFCFDTLDIKALPPWNIVIVIGQSTPNLAIRRRDLFVVFMCFSVFRNPRPYPYIDNDGQLMLESRQKKVEGNILPFIDSIIDFYMRHTIELRRHYAGTISVDWFPVIPALTEQEAPARDYRFDICVVGAATERRQLVYNQIANMGFILSPLKSNELYRVMRQSRLVLNIHSHFYDNIEFPRILLAMAMGVPVLSESCFGLSDVVPKGTIVCTDISSIASLAHDILKDEALMNRIGERSAKWIKSIYLETCWRRWRFLMDKLNRQALQKFVP